MNFNEKHKPFFHRTGTWITFAGVGSLLAVLLWGYMGMKEILETRVVDAKVVEAKTEYSVEVKKWTAKRSYNRSRVPECAWDIEEDTYFVCDRYNEECIARDSLGDCTSSIRTTCASGHYETDYDYNVMEWVEFTGMTCRDSVPCHEAFIGNFEDRKKWIVRTTERHLALVNWFEDERELMTNKRFNSGDVVRVRVRKKNGRVLKILEDER